MSLAFLKLYSFQYKAKTTMAAYSQPNQSKTSKIFTEINNFEIHQIFEVLEYTSLFSSGYLAIFHLSH
jgi:DNA polymerase III delta subunit